MATVTLTTGPVFPDGTTVRVYDFDDQAPAPSVPLGDAIATAVTSQGVATFTGLDYDTRYMAMASVGGQYRRLGFRTEVQTSNELSESLAANVVAAWTFAPPPTGTIGSGYGRLDFFGHSLYDTGSSSQIAGIAGRVSGILGSEGVLYGLPGARASAHDAGINVGDLYYGDGGWATVYRYANPGAHAAPYQAQRDGAMLLYGVNDFYLGTSDAAWLPFNYALEAIISRLRAAAVFEETDSSVTYPVGSWSTVTGGTEPARHQSGTSFKRTASGATAKVQIAVPADFPGGTVALSFLCDDSGHGALWDVAVDGGASTSVETRAIAGTSYWGPRVYRITNLASGAHTITATVSAHDTYSFFDCWWIEAPNPPTIAVCSVTYTDTHADADVDNANARIQDVVDSFDDDVIVVPLQSIVGDEDLSDGLHVNDQGCAKIASEVATAIAGANRTIANHARGLAYGNGLTRGAVSDDSNKITQLRPTHTPLRIVQSVRPSQTDLFSVEDINENNVFAVSSTGAATATGSVTVNNASTSVLLGELFSKPVILFNGTDTIYLSSAGHLRTAADFTADAGLTGGGSVTADTASGFITLVEYGSKQALWFNNGSTTDSFYQNASGDLRTSATVTSAIPANVAPTTFIHPTIQEASGAFAFAKLCYYCAIDVLYPCTVTGVQYWVGGTSNGNMRAALYTASGGTRLANRTSDSAQPTANTLHQVAFDSTYAITTPGRYYITLIASSGTGTAIQGKGLLPSTATVESSFVTPTSFTPPTAPLAGVPTVSLY